MLSIVSGLAASVGVFAAGWGFLLALLAYSFVGSVILVLAAAAAAWLEAASEEGRSAAPSRRRLRAATAHSG